MSNVVVSGYYGSKNAGDEAMLAAMVEVLSDVDPQINITVISANPADTERRHGVKAIGWLDVFSIAKALKSADLLISGGGSLLQNVTSGRSLYYYLGVIALAKTLGTPVMLYAQGIGPVCGAAARFFMRRIINGVRLITVRDKGSAEELRSLDVTAPPIIVTADPVLGIHPVPLDIGRKIFAARGLSSVKPLVGFSVREWRGWTQYKKALAALVDEISEKYQAQIVFLPMQVGEDVETAKGIAALTKSKPVVLDEEYTTNELLSLVGSLDLLVSVRLHALIFAGVMGVPMVGLSYDPKIDRFLASVGDAPAGDLQTITLDALSAAVAAKWPRDGKKPPRSEEMIGELRRLANQTAEEAVKLIEKRRA